MVNNVKKEVIHAGIVLFADFDFCPHLVAVTMFLKKLRPNKCTCVSPASKAQGHSQTGT